MKFAGEAPPQQRLRTMMIMLLAADDDDDVVVDDDDDDDVMLLLLLLLLLLSMMMTMVMMMISMTSQRDAQRHRDAIANREDPLLCTTTVDQSAARTYPRQRKCGATQTKSQSPQRQTKSVVFAKLLLLFFSYSSCNSFYQTPA